MKTKTYVQKPEFKVFLKFWLLIFSMMVLLVTGFYLILNQGEPIKEYLRSVGSILFALPLINGIIGAYNGRKHIFTITGIDDPAYVAGWAVDLLQRNGMRIQAEHQHQTVLEPAGNFLRWFGSRFGTEQATVNRTESAVTIIGNFNHIDVVATKIKFGQVAF